jgi:hypothetical protein
LLRPGGRLFLFEGHPLDFVWDEQPDDFSIRTEGTYFAPQPRPERGFPYEAAERVDPTKQLQLTSRLWTIGETVNAVIGAGLRIDHLEEFAEPFWDQFKNIPPKRLRLLPHTFGMIASK